MNATEKKARRWLSGTRELSEDEILFYPNKTPDFILPDGSKYEVKLLYKDKIILFPSQIRAFREQAGILILVFPRNGTEPMAIVPVGEILNAIDDKTMSWQNIKIVVYGEGQYKLQVYLSEELKLALDEYIAGKYHSDARIVTAVVRRALSEFLEKEGYLDRRGGEQ